MAGTPVTLAWYGCDFRTGRIIEDLPTIKPTQALSRKLGDFTTAAFELQVDAAPPSWAAATDQGRTMLVGVDTATDTPLWAGIVITRQGGSDTTVSIGCATPERYLDSRFPGTQAMFAVDKATVVSNLVNPALTAGGAFVLDAPAIGATMDYSVADADDKTCLSCVQEVMGQDGGPEWTVDVTWADDNHTAFSLPLRVRSTIGMQSTTPEGVFDFPGCVSSYSLSESYESGKGATVVIARGEGEGTSRLTSVPHEATALLANGWPRWEHRFTPSSGITDPDQLEAHATKSLALMQQGAQVWSIEATASQAPRLGRDWGLGDSVQLTVAHSPRHPAPAGASVVARCWAWELDVAGDKVRPVLVEE